MWELILASTAVMLPGLVDLITPTCSAKQREVPNLIDASCCSEPAGPRCFEGLIRNAVATQGSRHSERQGWFDQASIEGAGVQQGYVRPSQAPPLQLPDPQPVEHGCVVELHQMTVLNEELAGLNQPSPFRPLLVQLSLPPISAPCVRGLVQIQIYCGLVVELPMLLSLLLHCIRWRHPRVVSWVPAARSEDPPRFCHVQLNGDVHSVLCPHIVPPRPPSLLRLGHV